MTRRNRSILTDATLGKIFTNTSSVQAADASKLIAGTKLASSTISAVPRTAVARVTRNLSGNSSGIRFPSGGLVVSFIISASTASIGRAIIFEVRVGSSYATSTLLDTQQLEVNVKTKTVSVAWTIPAGNSLYVDVVQVGDVKPGNGLSTQFNYYTG